MRRKRRIEVNAGLILVITVIACSRCFAQQVQQQVLYSFCSLTNCEDGALPHGSLVFDNPGDLFGTTVEGGANCQGPGQGGCGTVFELSPSGGGGWTETVLYSFCVNDIQGCPDGASPVAGLIFDKLGNLYGTTQNGGTYGPGTVFELSPPFNQQGVWTETVLWSFGAKADGGYPLSNLIFDTSGRLYGTASEGGAYGGGMVFRLSPTGEGQWSEEILYSFGPSPADGFDPKAGVTFDESGNLYGTTVEGGSSGLGLGVVYRLKPNAQPPWTENVLFRFQPETGANPISNVSFDSVGNLYGTVSSSANGGVFRLSPSRKETSLLFQGSPGPAIPYAGVLIDKNSLYGTTVAGGNQDQGTVFAVHGTTATVLYSFCSAANCLDGYAPQAAVIGREGNLFGTTFSGGANGEGGVVYEISSELSESR
jgi:uncharacterized repeat protein (TIGR03803 family)